MFLRAYIQLDATGFGVYVLAEHVKELILWRKHAVLIPSTEMGWCCCSAEEEDFNKVSNDAHNQFSGHNGNPGKLLSM